MSCKVCTQLEEAVASAEMPDPPEILRGLTEAGMRNRARQTEERKLKAKSNLEKHQRSCQESEARAAF
jgi:hypothetical protein